MVLLLAFKYDIFEKDLYFADKFFGAWSDYIFPSMLFGDKQAFYTVAVGLNRMTDFRRIETYYTQFAAGALVVAIPIVILFICLQKFYVEGMSGSVKG